ncbi:monothiol glutaredoxin-5 [Coprinopsis cinerea AmutBmut pab1-1]|nr:monothiol glutaredoxin-5 [Coprinopsis cinerea AmutBmut pab1-1]
MAAGATRKSRRGLILGAILFVFVFIFYVPWELPASLVKGSKVDEIYGLLYLVTSTEDNGRALNEPEHLDVTQQLDWDIYAAGNPNVKWRKEAARIDKVHPIVVFSKTYCPYSRRAKQLLQSYNIHPPPKVVEVDTRDDGHFIKALLTRLTKHSTFPNVIIQGKSIGGSDNLQTLHVKGELKGLIEATGAKVRKPKAPPAM